MLGGHAGMSGLTEVTVFGSVQERQAEEHKQEPTEKQREENLLPES